MKSWLDDMEVGGWRWSLAALVLAVQACGGGGSAGPADAPPAVGVAPVAPATAAPAPVPVATLSVPAAPAPAPVVSAASPSLAAPVATGPAPATTTAGVALLQLDASTSCSIPGMRESILQQINEVRASGAVCGTQILPAAPALAWNNVLFSAAARHSLDMATRNYFSHTTPEGVDFAQRLSTEGYSGWIEGENIAAGLGSVGAAMSTWVGSEGHCRNIMQPLFTDVAVACVMRPGNTYGSYWSMELGAR